MMLLAAVMAAVVLGGAGTVLALLMARRKGGGRAAGSVAPAPDLALLLGADGGVGRATLVGFFDTDSAGCVRQASRFGTAARRMSGDAGSVAVIRMGRNSPDALLASLSDIQTLVLEEPGHDELASGFGVTEFPSFFLLDGSGAVTAHGRSVRRCLVR